MYLQNDRRRKIYIFTFIAALCWQLLKLEYEILQSLSIIVNADNSLRQNNT